jgi:cytosine/adenosine deaminase-related metal-dependent hydrolase
VEPASSLPTWWLDNILIESAIVDTDDGARTETSRGALGIRDGVIVEVRRGDPAPAPSTGSDVVDGDGKLLLPTLRDTHLHLDKTFYGGPWRAPIEGRFWLSEEHRLLPEMSDAIPVRSNAICDLIVSKGTTSVVAHCNVDHVVGSRNATRLLEVLHGRTDLDWEVVAYPQHGMGNGEVVPALREALDAGATILGGLDPGSRERDIERTLDTIFGLAVEYDVGIDFHLHDPGTLGLYELERIVDRAVDAGWQGRVSLSNAIALAGVDPAQARASAERLVEAGVAVGATVGVASRMLPIEMLDEVGVEVRLGSDSITDILTPFGQGDILEQVWMLAQHLRWSDERRLAQALVFGAGESARWNASGERAWPNIGDPATFMLVDASCTAEAVARRVARDRVFRDGVVVHPQ